MRDYRHRDLFENPIKSTTANRDAGRATLSDELEAAPHYSGSSVFAHAAAEPEVEPEDDVAEPDADLRAAIADAPALPDETAPADAAGPTAIAAAAPSPEAEEEATPPPAPADAVEVTAGDDPEALQRIYGDNKDKPHAAPFEKKKKHAEKKRVKQDRYNRGGIESDKIGKNVAARPGVVIKTAQGRDGVFMLKGKKATRYLYVKRGNQNVAEPFDIIERNDLAPDNYKHRDLERHENGNVKRLLLNPAMPRKLVINGKAELCVLTWIDGMTAAWMPVDEINGNTSKIVRAVKSRASKWDPKRVSNDPNELARKSKRYIIRNDKVGQKTPGDDPVRNDVKKPRVLSPGARGGNNVSHYLSKDIRKPGFGPDGKPLGKNVTRSVVAVTMNLPGPHEPPIAIDTAEAGQSFFVLRAKTFHRHVPVFENGKKVSNLLQHWVFGHLGMRDANGKLVPDPSRRGWLPLRTLADAKHLDTKDVEQRKPDSDD